MAREVPPVAKALEAHGPDHEVGFSERRLKKILSFGEMNDFKLWIRHQTIHIEGSVAYYFIDDVLRWAYGMERWRVETRKVS